MPTTTRRLPALLLLATLLSAAGLARAEIEFCGVLVTGDQPTFALADPAATQAQSWVTTGQMFAGWTVGAYDAKAQTLLLTKSGARLTLHLQDSVITEAAPKLIAGSMDIKFGNRTTTLPLSLTPDQTAVVALGDGVTSKITPHLLPDGNLRYQMSFERAAGAAGQPAEVFSSPSVIAAPGMAFNIYVGNLSLSFAPKPPPPAAP